MDSYLRAWLYEPIDPRLCACGCGQELSRTRGSRLSRRYYNGTCRVRAYRRRAVARKPAPPRTTRADTRTRLT